MNSIADNRNDSSLAVWNKLLSLFLFIAESKIWATKQNKTEQKKSEQEFSAPDVRTNLLLYHLESNLKWA